MLLPGDVALTVEHDTLVTPEPVYEINEDNPVMYRCMENTLALVTAVVTSKTSGVCTMLALVVVSGAKSPIVGWILLSSLRGFKPRRR